MIELDKASPGDRFEARDGEVWTFVERKLEDIRNPCVLTDGHGNFHFTIRGHWIDDDVDQKHDLIRALDAAAPAEPEQGDAAEAGDDRMTFEEVAGIFQGGIPIEAISIIQSGLGPAGCREKLLDLAKTKAAGVDAGLVAELKAAAVPFKPGMPGVLPSRALYGKAAIRIEALLLRATKAEAAMEEARKVIAPFAKAGELFAKAPYSPEFGQCIYNPAAGPEYSLGEAHLRAARDWHSKNGGGDV